MELLLNFSEPMFCDLSSSRTGSCATNYKFSYIYLPPTTPLAVRCKRGCVVCPVSRAETHRDIYIQDNSDRTSLTIPHRRTQPVSPPTPAASTNSALSGLGCTGLIFCPSTDPLLCLLWPECLVKAPSLFWLDCFLSDLRILIPSTILDAIFPLPS